MKVLKFGGSSVSTPQRIKDVIDIVLSLGGTKQSPVQRTAGNDNLNIAIVFSAFGGTTDQLIHLGTLASSGDESYKELFKQIEKRHFDAVKELVSIQQQSSVLANVKMM